VVYTDSVERYNAVTRQHADLFGIIDLIAITDKLYGIQACGSDFQEHVRKVLDVDHFSHLEAWLNAGGEFQIWAWRKIKKKRGGKQMVWEPRIANFFLGENTIEWEFIEFNKKAIGL